MQSGSMLALIRDECFIGQGLEGNRPFAGAPNQIVCPWQCNHHWLLQQRLNNKSGWICWRHTNESDIDPFVLQLVDKLVAAKLCQRDKNQWKGFAKRANYLWDERVIGARRCDADGNFALFAARGPLRPFDRALSLDQDCSGIFQEGVARLRQFNAARFATEQLYREFSLQPLDLYAQWRLLHVETFCCPRDVAFFGYRDEISKVTELHCHIQKISILHHP
jgi:hypothetical protein